MTAAAAVAVTLAGVGAWWLVDPLSAAKPSDRASAIQAAFAIAFGFGGIATLGLFARRQWHQERVHEHERQVAADARRESERAYEHQRLIADDARYDAEQRRITEQYMKAVEQLGHEKAPVRLGGLYALDRLGRNHPEQRRVITEVWCAYLRRRYAPPADVLGAGSTSVEGSEGAEPTEVQLQTAAAVADEFEVRGTAQRLLAGHLKDPRPVEDRNATEPDESEDYWHLERLDLTGATLVGADFADCRLPELEAARTHFYQHASFRGSYFDGSAVFDGASFDDDVEFTGARFEDDARFEKVRFGGDAWFTGLWFKNQAWFTGAQFEGIARFNSTRLGGGTMRVSVTPSIEPGDEWSESARSSTAFLTVRTPAYASFVGARFQGPINFDHLWSSESEDTADSAHAPASPIDMTDAIVDRLEFGKNTHVCPPGWGVEPDGDRLRLVPIED